MKYLLLSNEIFNDETGPTLNENAFHSFMVAKQIFLWQLPQLHWCNWQLLVDEIFLYQRPADLLSQFKEVLVMPTYSFQIPVIPVDSGAIPAEFTSQNLTPATEFWYSGNFTGTVPGIDWNEMALESSDQNEH